MFVENNFITIRQLKLLLILDIFGMGITILPQKAVEYGGQNGWILILIGILLSVICLFFINEVAKTFPNDNFVEYTKKILNKPFAYILSIGFIIKIVLSIAMQVRIFSEILKEIMLFNTPFWIISLSMLCLGGYMASKGYEARGRIAEILVFIVFIPLFFVFFVAMFDINFSNLQPFLKQISPKKFMLGGGYMLFFFSGIEFILLAYPYIKEKEKIKKASIGTILIVGIIMTITTLLTIARFGKYDITHQMWSVLEMMDTIKLPGSFIERQDALIMTFWIISIFMIVNAGVFFIAIISKDIVKKGTHTTFISIFIPIIYIISFLPKNIEAVYKIVDITNYTFGLFYMFILPIILYIVIKIRGLKDDRKDI